MRGDWLGAFVGVIADCQSTVAQHRIRDADEACTVWPAMGHYIAQDGARPIVEGGASAHGRCDAKDAAHEWSIDATPVLWANRDR